MLFTYHRDSCHKRFVEILQPWFSRLDRCYVNTLADICGFSILSNVHFKQKGVMFKQNSIVREQTKASKCKQIISFSLLSLLLFANILHVNNCVVCIIEAAHLYVLFDGTPNQAISMSIIHLLTARCHGSLRMIDR